MSLILDALNRSRQEVGEIPGLETRHGDEPARNNRSLLLLGLGLVLALGVIAWLLLDRTESAAPSVIDAPVVAQQAPARAPVTGTEPPPVAQIEPPADVPQMQQPAVEEAEVEELEEVAAPVESDSAVAALYAGQAQQSESPEAPGTKAEPAVVEVAQGEVADPSPREEPIDISKVISQARDEVENTRLSEHPAPFISALSQQTKDAIPTIFYERHDYSGKPGQSAVFFNGKKLVKGSSTASGVRVEEILPDSAVLNYKGTQFRLRALNSWVNL